MNFILSSSVSVNVIGGVDFMFRLRETWDFKRIFETKDFRLIIEGKRSELVYQALSCRSEVYSVLLYYEEC